MRTLGRTCAAHPGRVDGTRRGSVRSEIGTLRAELVDLAHGLAELAEPLVGVLADEPDRPGEGVAAGAGDAGVDEGVEDEALGLAMGADDYIAKPFSQRLLIARIRAILRRADRLRNEDLDEQ